MDHEQRMDITRASLNYKPQGKLSLNRQYCLRVKCDVKLVFLVCYLRMTSQAYICDLQPAIKLIASFGH
jgi:hypothetical protein